MVAKEEAASIQLHLIVCQRHLRPVLLNLLIFSRKAGNLNFTSVPLFLNVGPLVLKSSIGTKKIFLLQALFYDVGQA